MEKKELSIAIDPEISQGIYSNMVMITHTEGEFFLDFIFVPPQENQGKVRSRIVMSPLQLKRFFHALQQNLKLFEDKFGEISILPSSLPEYLT